jgi:hypothetical protein
MVELHRAAEEHRLLADREEPSGISTWRKSAARFTSMGRFTTMPSAPRSLCSQTKVRVREKFGSDIAGMAMRKWLVRLIVAFATSAHFTTGGGTTAS